MKHICFTCKKIAIWMYMPSSERTEESRYFCDDCIGRGCSCNIDPNTGIEDADDSGRLYPCCEYLYNDEGFEVDD